PPIFSLSIHLPPRLTLFPYTTLFRSFRVPEFMKIQLLFLQIIAVFLSFFFMSDQPWLWYLQAIQLILIAYHIYILIRYTALWKTDRKSTRLNSSHVKISYAVFCLKKK